MALQMKGIYKAFAANQVLKGVDFSLKDGEIRALLGENGAGKSTLMNILGGVLPADSGQIYIGDQQQSFSNPRESLNAGVAFIHQELNLVNDLPVYENLFLGREKRTRFGFVDSAAMIQEAQQVFKRLQVDIDVRTMLSALNTSYKQVVEIAKALLMDAQIIIMDEPTTSLTESEIVRVFEVMRSLKIQGVGIVFISHKLGEVMDVCDSYTVLRDGHLVAEGLVRDTNERELAYHMVGHEIESKPRQVAALTGEVTLKAQGLSLEGVFANIDFEAHRGEVLGFTGLLGDGRSDLFQTVFGCNPRYTGEIYIDGESVRMNSTEIALKYGIGYVPRNRKENGIIKDMNILENGSLIVLKQLTKLLLIDRKKEEAEFSKQAQALRIKMQSEIDPITSLSGGNQQKVVLAKWLSANPQIIIFDNPTQGVDVGAKEDIYHIIGQLSQAGITVIVLSGEAQEIVRLCDRVMVMFHGRIQGQLTGSEINEQNIMLLATGGTL